MNKQTPHKNHYGEVSGDPALNPQDGDEIRFQPVIVQLLKSDTTVTMENLDAFNGVVLTFNFADSAEHDMDGSAVMVAPGVALSAKHVIEQHMERLTSGEKHSICLGIAKTGMNIWTVRKVTMLNNCDIAILGLELASDFPHDRTFRQACISTRLPKIGERVQIVGFRAEEATRESPGGQYGYGVAARLFVSAGVVTNRYPERRDSIMLPWPVLEVDCPSWGGMSGGPVFDEHGNLIGLLCSSFSDESGDGPSYASLLWPALAQKFEGGWPAAAFPNARSLLDMSEKICRIDRPDVISIVTDQASGLTHTSYAAWE